MLKLHIWVVYRVVISKNWRFMKQNSKLLKRPKADVKPYLSSQSDLGIRIHMRLLISCQLLCKNTNQN